MVVAGGRGFVAGHALDVPARRGPAVPRGAQARGLVLLAYHRCRPRRSAGAAPSLARSSRSTGGSSPPCSPSTSPCSLCGSSPSLDASRGGWASRSRRPRRADRRAARGGGLGHGPQLRRARQRLRRRGAVRHGVRPRLGAARERRPAAAASGCRRTRGSGRSSSGSGRARSRRSRPTRACVADTKPAGGEAVDDDPAARHRRGPGQLGRPHGHDHPRRRPARHRPGRRLRRPAQPRAGAAGAEGPTVEGADERASTG